jgi:hypothetical protein
MKAGTLPQRCYMIARDSFLALRQGVEGARGRRANSNFLVAGGSCKQRA